MTDRLRLDKDDHGPWLKYPDPNKQYRPFYSTHKHQNHHSSPSYHGHHSRSSPAGTTPPVPGLLHHKRSASRLAQQQHHHQDVNSLSSLSSHSNSSSDSLGQSPHPSALTSTTTATTSSAASLHQHHQQQQPQPQQPLLSKPRSLSDELSSALSQDSQSSSANIGGNGLGSHTLRPSLISPSDILGIPDRSSLRPDSPSLRRLQRSSPLSLSLDTHSNGDSNASPQQEQTAASNVSSSSPVYSSFSSGGSTTASEEPLSPRVGLPPPAPIAAALSSPSASSASLLLSTTQRQQQQQQTVPRLSHSLSLSSSSSVSSSSSNSSTSSSTPSSPSSSTAPCSALCRHSQSRHSYTDRHHPSPSSSSQHLRHHPACNHGTGHGHSTHVRRTHSVHRNPRHHNHHPSCPQTSLSHGNGYGSELSPFGKHAPEDFAATGAIASSPSLVGHPIAVDQDMSITTSPLTLLPVQQQDGVQMHDQKEVVSRSLSREDDIPFPDDILLLEKASPSTAVTVVDTKAYGIQAYKALRDRDLYEQHPYLGEPPKKKMRSTAAMLFGAAVETVIFTGAVALSAYQLLTGKGRQASQQQEEVGVEVETETTPVDAFSTDDVLAQPEAPESAKPLMIESAPVNIPSSRSLHHRHSGHFKRSPQAAGSLHHSQYVHGHHRHQHHHHHHQPHHNHSNSHRKSSSRRQGGLASSLPHSSHMSAAARGEDPYSQSRQPTRPNTGTEDNDEQFLRMEAQLSNLIAEGKRALGSEIPDWRKFPSGSTIY